MSYSNGLKPPEIERLAKLAEECAETIQVVGKILVHGWESTHPRRPEQGTNREHLAEEVGHIGCMVDMMTRRGDFSMDLADKSYFEKKETIGKYLHHQEGL